MPAILTAARMRALERATIDSGSVIGLDLMERAGAGVVAAVLSAWPELAAGDRRAVVLAGPGNNGGDGLVVARQLQVRGWDVTVFRRGALEKMPPDARTNLARWSDHGGTTIDMSDTDRLRAAIAAADLVVDALFGIGLTRGIVADRNAFSRLLAENYTPRPDRPQRVPHVVAIDIPSGLCADSGRVIASPDQAGFCIAAALTVTFHTLKPGHLLAEGPQYCGKVVVTDIGLPDAPDPGDAPTLRLVAPPFDGLSKPANAHKYSHGHALILSGGAGQTGAARLAARGALRIGAGLVTLGAPPAAMAEAASHLTAIMLTPLPDAAALAARLADPRCNALCLGPGFGLTAREAALTRTALASLRAVVLDADALTLLANTPDLFARLHPTCVLTPHHGEFARLFPDIAARLAAPATSGPACSKVDATRDAARRAGCVVLYKGPDTVIADPTGRAAIHSAAHDRAAPWLAKAGSGDVLAGFIAGLLARGFTPFDAACAATWLHVECARQFGPGLIAEDLSEQLPQVFRALGL